MTPRTYIARALAVSLLLLPLLAAAQIQPVTGPGSNVNLIVAMTRIINGILALLAVVAVIFVIVGAVQYMVAAGDDEAMEKAKRTILYALIGLIIAALAFAIVNFIVNFIVF